MDVWLDSDPAAGARWRDVDDALALYTLVRAGIRVAGLSTVFGNAALPVVDRIGRALGARLGVPVVTGAACAGDRDTAAVEALLGWRGVVVAIGPLTNVAAALDRGARFERLIVLGGTDRRLPNLRPLHTTELNFALDEAAAARVLQERVELVPMEPCRDVWFGRAHIDLLPPWLRDPCRAWITTSPLRHGRRAFHPWDVLPVMWLLQPEHFRARRARVALASAPLRRGYVAYAEGDDATVIHAVDAARMTDAWCTLVRPR